MGRFPKSSPPGSDTLARPGAGQQRAEHHHRGPHLLHQLVGRLGDEGRRGVDDEVPRATVGVVGTAHHLRADGPEDLGHDLDVHDARHPGQDVAARRQQARRHQLESRVLGPPGAHRPVQRPAGADDEAVHRSRPDQTTGFSAQRPKTDARAPTISPTVA